MKVMFVDLKKAHLNSKCGEEEWVELPNEFRQFGRYTGRTDVGIRDKKRCVGMGRRPREKVDR